MGFVLSILYFVTYYLTPTTLFGPLAEYRIELILAVLVIVVSLLALTKSFVLKTPQSLALIGLALAVVLSVLIAQRWPGGSVKAFLDFIPNALAYFLVCLHCNSKRKLQVLVAMLLFVCLFVIARGSIDLHRGVQESALVQPGTTEVFNVDQWNADHPYLFVMENDQGELLYRIRGQGLINDPNDFGQMLICVIPLVFIFWRRKRLLLNIVFVLLPVSILLLGVYLTHSRGALLALIVIAVVFTQWRVGKLLSLLLAAGMFVGAMALNFTGGRGISASSGEDRTILWGEGLQLLRSHPFSGVGLGGMPSYTGLTAHNSIVVCAAELGLFGLYFWSMFLLPTIRDALAIASPGKVSEARTAVIEERAMPYATSKIKALEKAEVIRLGRLTILSLTGFLAAGWFLSRAFVMTLFLLGGIAEVVYQMALERGMIGPRMRMRRVLLYAGGMTFALVLTMYIVVLTLNRIH
jgi:hypothetical protein